jgi:hypothetical protein
MVSITLVIMINMHVIVRYTRKKVEHYSTYEYRQSLICQIIDYSSKTLFILVTDNYVNMTHSKNYDTFFSKFLMIDNSKTYKDCQERILRH